MFLLLWQFVSSFSSLRDGFPFPAFTIYFSWTRQEQSLFNALSSISTKCSKRLVLGSPPLNRLKARLVLLDVAEQEGFPFPAFAVYLCWTR